MSNEIRIDGGMDQKIIGAKSCEKWRCCSLARAPRDTLLDTEADRWWEAAAMTAKGSENFLIGGVTIVKIPTKKSGRDNLTEEPTHV